jgi:hypothetical protein
MPLVVIVTKFDAWKHLLGTDLPVFYAQPKSNSICGLRIGLVEQVSQRVRQLILDLAPEIDSAAQRFSRHVYFVPSSATGCSPRVVGRDDATGRPTYKFRVGDLAPQWAEVPLLWMLSRHVPGLVPVQTVKE